MEPTTGPSDGVLIAIITSIAGVAAVVLPIIFNRIFGTKKNQTDAEADEFIDVPKNLKYLYKRLGELATEVEELRIADKEKTEKLEAAARHIHELEIRTAEFRASRDSWRARALLMTELYENDPKPLPRVAPPFTAPEA